MDMQPSNSRDRASVFASIAIYVSVLALAVAVFVSSPHRSVSFFYEDAAQAWLDGQPLYNTSKVSGHGFLYLPQAAILHLPYALTSRITGSAPAGNILYRILSWALFAFSLVRITKDFPGTAAQTQWRVAILAGLLGVSALRIGQSTLLMAALMTFSLMDWQEQRWTRAAVWIALAVAVKPLAIVLPMLLFVVSRPMRIRLVASALAATVAPFAFQWPGYVWQQYVECLTMLRTAAEVGNNYEWAQLFGMLDFLGLRISGPGQTTARLIAAVGTLALVYQTTKRMASNRQAIWILFWTVAYLMLFNPRNENSTFAMTVPVYGYCLCRLVAEKRLGVGWLVFGLAILTAGSFELGRHLTPEGRTANWLAPLAFLTLLPLLTTLYRSSCGSSPVTVCDGLPLPTQAS